MRRKLMFEASHKAPQTVCGRTDFAGCRLNGDRRGWGTCFNASSVDVEQFAAFARLRLPSSRRHRMPICGRYTAGREFVSWCI